MGCGSSQPDSQETKTINFLKSALKSRRNTARTPIILLPPPVTPDNCPRLVDLFVDNTFICQNRFKTFAFSQLLDSQIVSPVTIILCAYS